MGLALRYRKALALPLLVLLAIGLVLGGEKKDLSPQKIPSPQATKIIPAENPSPSPSPSPIPSPTFTPSRIPGRWGFADDPFFLTNFDMRFYLGDKDSSPYNGYFWNLDRAAWVPGMISNRTWYLPSPEFTIGGAVYYASGVMEATARVRGMSLKGFVGGVSLLSPADIGETVWLRRWGEQGWEGPFLVVDCARRSDEWPIIYYRGEVVEVDFHTAMRWGMVNGSYERIRMREDGVEVWKGIIPPGDPGIPIDLREWWIPRAEWVKRWEDPPIFESGGTWRWWDGSPWLATDPEDLPPAEIFPAPLLPDEECLPENRKCGNARAMLIRWGQY